MFTVARRIISILFGIFLLQPVLCFACSDVACVGNGTEFSKDFAVAIAFRKQPISDAIVKISGNGTEFFEKSDTNGVAHIRNLSPGLYWIEAEVFGTGVAYQCFHVEAVASSKARRKLRLQWGNDAPAVTAIQGRIVDLQPDKTGKPAFDLLHRVEVGIAATHFQLRDPISHISYAAISDDKGRFIFHQVPEGTYVLHAEGGQAGDRVYDGTDLVIALSARGRPGSLLLARREAAGGSCGGTSLEIRDVP